MKKKVFIQAILVILMAVLMVGCAHWAELTRQEKARTVADGIQEELDEMFDSSKMYLDLHPEYQEKWKTKIVPAFDLANKTLKEVSELAKMEVITPDEVRQRMIPLLNRLIRYLVEIGAK